MPIVALAALSACEESSDKAGGDPSQKPSPTPSPTAWSWSTSTSNTTSDTTSSTTTSGTDPSGVTSTDATPTAVPDDALPGDASTTGSSGTDSPQTSGTSSNSGTSSWTGANGTSVSTETTGATGSTGATGTAETKPQAPAPCRTMTVFNTSGNGVYWRSQPHPQGEPVEILPEGTTIEASGLVEGVWVAGKANGKSGYAVGNFLTCDAGAAAQGQGGANPEGEAAAAGKAVSPEQPDCGNR